jgi:allophanate hydrolase subunit 2
VVDKSTWLAAYGQQPTDDGRTVRTAAAEIESIPLALGAIQVPPDGRPIVMLADRPVTGGYPVPACVIGADIGRVAALRPGDRVRFRSVSRDAAREARVGLEGDLASVEDLGSVAGDELGWAGAIG